MTLSWTREISIGSIALGGSNPLGLIAGPCVIENLEHTLKVAGGISEIVKRLGLPWVFKASYDKANRSSGESYRGPGLVEGLRILARVREEFGCPVMTDVHSVAEVAPVAQGVDMIQIPAFLSRQTDLVVAAAKSGKVVNIKKGQFLAPWDMKNVVAKVESAGCKRLLLTERGASFGYNNLVSDMRSLVVMRELGYPVVYDASHSVQLPGGQGDASGGQREMVAPLARAAVAAGVDAVLLEVHDNPDQALSDGPNSLQLEDLESLLKTLAQLDAVVRS